VAIIVANIPILRGLVTRWIFDFRTKSTPLEREAHEARENCKAWDTQSSSEASRYKKRARVVQKLFPCIQDDFSSSLASHGTGEIKPDYPPRVATPQKRSYFPRSRRNSLDRYEQASSCEKGDLLETVCSVGSLGSAPTLVDEKSSGVRWKSMDLESPPLSPIRYSGTTLSPITPLTPLRLRGVEDVEDEAIYSYPRLR